jgi:hypothetical protein
MVAMVAENASVTVQYLMYRYGMNSFWVGILLIVGFSVSLLVLLFAEPLIRLFGELTHSTHSVVVIGVLSSCAWVLNPYGGVWLGWSAIVGTTAIGQLVIATMPQRLVDYHAQATVAASLHSIKGVAQACVRLPITALFSYGIQHSNLTDYTLHVDCSDELLLRSHCDGHSQHRLLVISGGAMNDSSNATLSGSNAALNGTACDIMSDDGCVCPWKSVECPEMPPLFAAQGGPFDALASVYIGTGVIGIASAAVWFYLVCKLDPVGEMEERRVSEISKWKREYRHTGYCDAVEVAESADVAQ